MRVGLRRLRAAISLFSKLFGDEAPPRAVPQSFKKADQSRHTSMIRCGVRSGTRTRITLAWGCQFVSGGGSLHGVDVC